MARRQIYILTMFIEACLCTLQSVHETGETLYCTFGDILPVDLNAGITIGSCLFMVETDGMGEFVNSDTFGNAT